ncbi:hypothetical protein [Flavobacterium cerinum]|uniref:Phage tail protein n=1 Tax=Flavobacterium cerinum TaxID=2502784 RepID=A0ABY5IXT5_9FLAO|nr:hypothetical protein [Flavobacterium cerinum]UUC46518.1 hypothetical protein NOX80_04785 [Flavobacterium cerinum]
MNYKTPGVYVEEISKFPPSVAQVETAIPAFIGYTEKGTLDEPTRIASLMEYEALFGGADFEGAHSITDKPFTIDILDDVATATLNAANLGKFKMYYAMQMYFANGGGPCYIVAVNHYKTGAALNAVDFDKLNAGLNLLEKEDEPTLIVYPDAEGLTVSQAHSLYVKLNKPAEIRRTFVIMDSIGGVLLSDTC